MSLVGRFNRSGPSRFIDAGAGSDRRRSVTDPTTLHAPFGVSTAFLAAVLTEAWGNLPKLERNRQD
jgi:hypothetical protein